MRNRHRDTEAGRRHRSEREAEQTARSLQDCAGLVAARAVDTADIAAGLAGRGLFAPAQGGRKDEQCEWCCTRTKDRHDAPSFLGSQKKQVKGTGWLQGPAIKARGGNPAVEKDELSNIKQNP